MAVRAPKRPWDFDGFFGRPRRRFNPLPIPWRWRYEALVGLGVAAGLHGLAAAIGTVAAVGVATAATVGCVVWPPARRFLGGRIRSVVVAHRLRVGMVEASILSWRGRLPMILRASPTPRGVRVVLWCPAGVDVKAFNAGRELLAAACWAADVYVDRHRRWAQLVVVIVEAG